MKQLVGGLCLLLMLIACGNKRQSSSSVTTTADTIVRKQHSLLMTDASAASYLVPPADETFDDFICRLFGGDNYYTLLFDREKEIELEVMDDAEWDSIQVEWTTLKTRTTKTVCYKREEGIWQQQDSCEQYVEPTEGNDDFLSFYIRFAADSLYQQSHIAEPLVFITIDPDDESSILETTLEPGQWYAFRPQLPVERLTNINYGQQNHNTSHTKVLKVNGVGNGYSVLLYFKKTAREWQLYKFEDTGI
ncbi:MAG: DUF4348 domain-containing protein [Prevotellaceae bacterium]|jgi:hypothetical protein|nr:DUF4348 domain-containing protein [Prevotellaceae bacterium]